MAMAQPSKLEVDFAVPQGVKLQGIAIRARESDIAQREVLRSRLKPPSSSCSLALTSPPRGRA